MANNYVTKTYLTSQFQNYSEVIKDNFAKKDDVSTEKLEYTTTKDTDVTNVKEALDTLFSGGAGEGEENAIESISVNGTPITPDTNKNVDIAVPTISAEQDNALIEKQDGLYVPSVSETKVSEAEGNSIEVKDDGIYVAPTDLSDYAKNDDIPDVSNFVEKEDGKGLFSGSYNDLTDQPTIPSVDGLVSEEQLTQTLADYAKTEDLPSEYDDTAIKQSIADLETTVENVYTKDETYSRAEVDEAITNAQIGGEEVDLSSYATKEYVDNAVNDVNVDLTGYATETFVTDKIAEIEIPSLDGYAKTEDVPTVTNDLTDELKEQYDKAEENVQSDWDETDETSDAFIKNKPTIPSLSGYATETWVNEQGFLTQHQDLSNYATKDEIPTVPSKVSELTNDSNYQTVEQVNSAVTTEIAKVVADAPEDFNTLKEMSDWIAGHEDDASAMNSAISDNKTAITALQTDKADKSEIPTTLPANGGNADTVNNHTVESDVPTNAVFTDTVYDDTALKTELTTAIATAKSEAIETILGEAVSEDFDTLQEVADWIQADTTSSAELIIRVTNAESDIDTLEETISNKVDKINGKGLSTNDFTDTYQSDVDGNTTARHTHSNTTILDNTTASFTIEEKEKLSSIKEGAESSVSTVTGVNPTVTNSTKAPIIYLKEDGYVEQKTLSGKNLMKVEKSGSSWQCDVSVADDGKITLTNTATTSVAYGRVGLITFKANTTYTISVHNASNLKDITFFKPGVPESVNIAYTHSSVTVTPSSDVEAELIVYMNDISTVGNKTTVYVQVEEGTTATPYEPYVGGTASPNPDYPQDIVGAGNSGSVELTTCGKNLLDVITVSDTKNGLTITVNDDKSVTINGTATADTTVGFGTDNTLRKRILNKEVIFSGSVGGSYYNYLMQIWNYNSNNKIIYSADGDSVPFVFTNSDSDFNIVIYIWSGATLDNVTFYPMIRLASTEDSTYEPYQETVATIPIDSPLYEGDYIEIYADGSGKLVRGNYRLSENFTVNRFYNEAAGIELPYYGRNTGKQNYSNYFLNGTGFENGKMVLGEHEVGAYSHAYIKIEGLTTVEEYRTWIKNHPDLEIVYRLTTPTETPLTAEQVEQFKKLYTFNDVTYINTDDGEVTVRYYCNTGGGGTVGMLHEQIASVGSYIKALEERLTALEKC